MPKLQFITTNMTAGVWSPLLRGRTDLEKYNSSLRDGENIVILKQGGMTARPSLDYLAPIHTENQQARLVPLIYSNDDAFALEFGPTHIRFWKDGELIESSPGVPYTVSNPYSASQNLEFDYVYEGDTLIMVHPDVRMQRLRRFADDSWVFDAAPLDPGPIGEVGARANIQMTLSAATVGSGRTLTAGSGFFREADVGRPFTCGIGVAEVTAYTSTTQVTVEITAAFAATVMAGNTWLLEGSPLCRLTPSDKDPVGASMSLVASVSAFRTADIGSYVQINGGLCRIVSLGSIGADSDTYDGDGATTTFDYTFQLLSPTELTVLVDGVPKAYTTDYTLTNVGNPSGGRVEFLIAPPGTAPNNVVFSRGAGSPNTAAATIVQELTSITEAPEDAWVLKSQLWNAVDGYPSAVTLFQQRLWAANTERYPQSAWGSRSGLFFDFTPGTDDDHAVYKTLDSRRANPIRYLHSDRTLVALTDPAEFEMRGGVEKPITQTNASISKQSGWGCAAVKPEDVGDNLLFVQRGGKVLRAVLPLDVEGFAARDVSIFSEHLLEDGVAGITFQQAPGSVAWCWLDSGDFVATTYTTEQNIIAMAPCSTSGGRIESMCTIPEGDKDMTYAIVRRVVDGSVRRYVERFNWDVNPGMDSRAVGTGGPTTWGGFDHLEGKEVTVLVDGIAAGMQTVSGGEITTDAAADEVVAGIAYIPRATLQDVEVGTGTGTAQGAATSVHKVIVRFFETSGCSIGTAGEVDEDDNPVTQPLLFEQFGDDPLDGAMPLFTGDISAGDFGWTGDNDAPLEISQPQPYPWTVLAVIRHLTINAG